MTAKTGPGVPKKTPNRQQSRTQTTITSCRNPKLNQLWSIWYCTMTIAFQIYIIVHSIKRFMRYISLPWPPNDQPYLELNAYVGLVGTAVVMLPFFVVSAILRVGNYSNDGNKIGTDPEGNSASTNASNGDTSIADYQNLSRSSKCARWFKSMWRHGGPTAPILHIASAFCLLIPTVLIQAQLVRHGFLSKADIWKTDLDFFLPHRDRLVVLGFLSTVNQTEALHREELDRSRPRLHDETGTVRVDDLSPVSAEFVNYAIALMVHAVRYPSVFWKANKSFGLLFSVQLIADALQKLIAFAGFTVLYKIHLYGEDEVLLRHNPLILNVPMTLLLFLLYNVVLTLSGSVLYLYGLQKYREWRESTVRKTHVTWKEESRRLWGHVPHVSAFMILLMIALTTVPLMYDYTMVYCGSLDGAMLAGVTGTVTHLFVWIVMWLVLTVKHKWQFNRQGLYEVYNDLDGTAQGGLSKDGGKEPPLLVIENGLTYQIREKASKKAIINLAQRAGSPVTQPAKPMSPASADDEDIYWLKPKPTLPKDNKDSPESDRLAWLKTHKKNSGGARHKVSFEEKGATSGSPCKRTRSSASTKSPKQIGKSRKGVKFEDLSDSNSEDGDYATLREMVVLRDETDEEQINTQPLFHAPQTGRGQHRRILSADGDYELLMDDGYIKDSESDTQINAPVIVHNGVVPLRPMHRNEQILLGDGYEPLMAAQDGHLTPKSDSVSDTSTSPEKGGCGSESSSGVHSNSSTAGDNKRASSMENLLQDLVAQTRPIPWKSMSLQRNTPPPPPHNSDKLSRLAPGSNTAPRPNKPDAIYFDPQDSTLVIRRKQKQNSLADPGIVNTNGLGIAGRPDHFGRATNMRMTSFTDQPDFPNGNTVTHQQLMLSGFGSPKKHPSLPSSPRMIGSDGNQNSMPGPHGMVSVPHGLMSGPHGLTSSTSRVKSFAGLLGNGIYGTTKPMGMIGPTTLLPMYPVHQRRDSANYSLTSSGDSDTYMSHT